MATAFISLRGKKGSFLHSLSLDSITLIPGNKNLISGSWASKYFCVAEPTLLSSVALLPFICIISYCTVMCREGISTSTWETNLVPMANKLNEFTLPQTMLIALKPWTWLRNSRTQFRPSQQSHLEMSLLVHFCCTISPLHALVETRSCYCWMTDRKADVENWSPILQPKLIWESQVKLHLVQLRLSCN